MPTKEDNAILVLPEYIPDYVQFELPPEDGPKHVRKHSRRLNIHFPSWLRRFIKSHGILLGSLVFLVAWTFTCITVTRHNTTVEVTERLTAEFETQLESYTRSLEAQRQAENLLTEDASKRILIEKAATIMAKSFYGHRNVVTSDNDYYTIGWVEWFRVASGGEFANQTSLEEVISQPNAFMGYTENNPVIETQFNIAKEICTDYFEGRWPTTEKFVYFDWGQGKVIARNDYNTNSRTEYWWYGK